ncbi:MAG: hypothetical protein V1874_16730 [Spirochaetota bacterium]
MEGKRIGNRRRGPDALTKAITIFAAISWALIFIVFLLITYGKPRMGGTFFAQAGDSTMTNYANIALGVVFFVCLVGLLINMNRHKRKSDRFSKSLIFFGIGSIIWLIYNLMSK